MNIGRFALLCAVGSLWACSSGTSGGGGNPNGFAGNSSAQSGSYCATVCGKFHQCDGSEDLQTCTASCENDFAATGPKLRAEYVSKLQNCVTAKDCATVLSGGATSQCAEEAAAALAPTQEGTSFCNQIETAAGKCGGGSDKAQCLQAAKQFSDGALKAAEACLQKACADIESCIDAQLGMQSSSSSSSGSNSCEYAYDGYCDEGEYCEYGTDSYDCSGGV